MDPYFQFSRSVVSILGGRSIKEEEVVCPRNHLLGSGHCQGTQQLHFDRKVKRRSGVQIVPRNHRHAEVVLPAPLQQTRFDLEDSPRVGDIGHRRTPQVLKEKSPCDIPSITLSAQSSHGISRQVSRSPPLTRLDLGPESEPGVAEHRSNVTTANVNGKGGRRRKAFERER